MTHEHPFPITLAPEALDWMARHRPEGSNDAVAVLGVRKRGCAGFSYTLEWHRPPSSATHRLQRLHGPGDSTLTMAIAHTDIPWLQGTHLRLERRPLQTRLVWDNPQAQDACGCGESVHLTAREAPALDR